MQDHLHLHQFSARRRRRACCFSHHFDLQRVDMYVLCVCVYAHTHTLHVGYSDVSPGVGTRHLESPEEIQMYCRDSIHIYRAVYEVHMYIYMLGDR